MEKQADIIRSPKEQLEIETESVLVSPPRQNRHALLIGIDKYASRSLPSLQFCGTDMQALRDALIHQEFCTVTVLSNHHATREHIVRRLTTFAQRFGEDDFLLVYFCGHGILSRDTAEATLGSACPDPSEPQWLPPDAGDDEILKETPVAEHLQWYFCPYDSKFTVEEHGSAVPAHSARVSSMLKLEEIIDFVTPLSQPGQPIQEYVGIGPATPVMSTRAPPKYLLVFDLAAGHTTSPASFPDLQRAFFANTRGCADARCVNVLRASTSGMSVLSIGTDLAAALEPRSVRQNSFTYHFLRGLELKFTETVENASFASVMRHASEALHRQRGSVTPPQPCSGYAAEADSLAALQTITLHSKDVKMRKIRSYPFIATFLATADCADLLTPFAEHIKRSMVRKGATSCQVCTPEESNDAGHGGTLTLFMLLKDSLHTANTQLSALECEIEKFLLNKGIHSHILDLTIQPHKDNTALLEVQLQVQLAVPALFEVTKHQLVKAMSAMEELDGASVMDVFLKVDLIIHANTDACVEHFEKALRTGETQLFGTKDDDLGSGPVVASGRRTRCWFISSVSLPTAEQLQAATLHAPSNTLMEPESPTANGLPAHPNVTGLETIVSLNDSFATVPAKDGSHSASASMQSLPLEGSLNGGPSGPVPESRGSSFSKVRLVGSPGESLNSEFPMHLFAQFRCPSIDPEVMDALGNVVGPLMCHTAGIGDVNVLSKLLAAGVDVNAFDYDRRTALHVASAEGRIDVVSLLLECPNINTSPMDRFGNTPLHDALRGRHNVLVPILRSKGARLMSSLEVTAALCKAAGQGDIQMLSTLLDFGYDVNAGHAYNDHRTPLHLASASGNYDAVVMLLEAGAKVNATDRWGGTPLSDAIRLGHARCAEVLRRFGGELGTEHQPEDPAIALCKAAGLGDIQTLISLLDKEGVYVSARHPVYACRTPLHFAAACGQMNACQILLERGAKVDVTDRTGNTPLTEAIRSGHEDIAALLRSHGGTTQWGIDDAAQLCLLAASDNVVALKRLIKNGVDINMGDYDGHTPLHLAASVGSIGTVAFLLENGAYPNQPDNTGTTPAMEAQRHGHTDVVKLLMLHSKPSNYLGPHPDMSGFLRRRENGMPLLRIWGRKWMELRRHFLYQFPAKDQRPTGTLELVGAKIELDELKAGAPSNASKVAFTITSGSVSWHILTANEAERTQWVNALRNAIQTYTDRLPTTGVKAQQAHTGRRNFPSSSDLASTDDIGRSFYSGVSPTSQTPSASGDRLSSPSKAPDRLPSPSKAKEEMPCARANGSRSPEVQAATSPYLGASLAAPFPADKVTSVDELVSIAIPNNTFAPIMNPSDRACPTSNHVPTTTATTTTTNSTISPTKGSCPAALSPSVASSLGSGPLTPTTPPAHVSPNEPDSNPVSPSAVAAPPAPPPHQLPLLSKDDLEVLTLLGRGAFGKVVKVRHKGTGMIFAMKVLRKDLIIKHNLVQSTIAEREVLQGVCHPFIVSLHYAFQTSEKLYLLLTYLPGGDLLQQLRKAQRFKPERARLYVAQITLALEELHSHNVLYRDLKAENICLDKDGNAILTDFGMAKYVSSNCASTATFCGTPEYLAPEVVKHEPYTKAVDWWCLGVLLYQMLVGCDPFRSRDQDSNDDLYNQILSRDVQYPPGLPDHAVNLMKGLMHKDPHRRFTCTQVREHPFMRGIDWDKVLRKEIKPLYVPPMSADDKKYIKGNG